MQPEIHIDPQRLNQRLVELAQFGALPEGGISRLALTDADKSGRDLFVSWLRDLSLDVRIDQVGNILAFQPGRGDAQPVLLGSHLDTVRAAGPLDGALGVLAGLEVLQTLQELDIHTLRPVALVAFTNEEGARFTTDMMGSRAFCGELPVEDAWDVTDFEGVRVGDELRRIGYSGDFPCGQVTPAAYLELHIEQGPVLYQERVTIGAVEAITGISWQAVTITGAANHAGTTPLDARRDAGLAAAKVIQYLRELAQFLPDQRATCGRLSFSPDVINVIPGQAVLTVDLRNGEDAVLKKAEQQLAEYLAALAEGENVEVTSRILMRVSPSRCDPSVVTWVETAARGLGLTCRRMVSGAGHDAQIMAHTCPTAMIFIPSQNGISHSPAEYSRPKDIEAGANVLLHTVLGLADGGTG